MKKFLVLLLAFSFSSAANAMLQGGNRYMDLMESIGATGQIDLEEFESLFAKNCKKIVNTQTVAHNRAGLFDQLTEAVASYGAWNMNLIEIIPNETENCCTVYCEPTGSKGAHNIVMKVLKFEENAISEILEVYAPVWAEPSEEVGVVAEDRE